MCISESLFSFSFTTLEYVSSSIVLQYSAVENFTSWEVVGVTGGLCSTFPQMCRASFPVIATVHVV